MKTLSGFGSMVIPTPGNRRHTERNKSGFSSAINSEAEDSVAHDEEIGREIKEVREELAELY